jgi:hypothetical protein
LTVVSAVVTYFYLQYNSELAGVTGKLLITIYLLNGLVCLVSFAIWVVNIKEKPFLTATIVSLLVIFFDILLTSVYMGYIFLDSGKVLDFFVLYLSLLLGAVVGLVINKGRVTKIKGVPRPPSN